MRISQIYFKHQATHSESKTNKQTENLPHVTSRHIIFKIWKFKDKFLK